MVGGNLTFIQYEIREYELDYTKDYTRVKMPAMSTVKNALSIHGKIILIVQVDPSQKEEERTFRIIKSYEKYSIFGESYIGSVVHDTQVLHIFEYYGLLLTNIQMPTLNYNLSLKCGSCGSELTMDEYGLYYCPCCGGESP